MLQAKNKFFDAVKLPEEMEFKKFVEKPFNYIDFFSQTPLESVSGSNEKPEKKQYRLKQEYQYQTDQVTLSPILQGAIDLMNQNPNLKGKYKITSTVRAARYANDKSHHIKGMAFDIVPVDGDFQKLQQEIAKDTNLINYLQRNNLGIIVEVGPEARAKYKATGDNLHFGPDSDAIAGLNQLISQFRV